MKKIEELYYKIYHYLQNYGIVIAYIVFGLFILMALASCKTIEQQETVYRDSIVYRTHTDTLRVINYKRDTLVMRDSVRQYIYQKGDTLIYRERIVNNTYNTNNTRVDTVKAKIDTLYTDRVVYQNVEKQVEPSKWDKLMMYLKGSLLGVIAIALVIGGVKIYDKFIKK